MCEIECSEHEDWDVKELLKGSVICELKFQC